MPAFTEHSWFLTGATATGKSRIALELAKQLDAEIVAMDSMTLYRGMNIGTDKPSDADRDACPITWSMFSIPPNRQALINISACPKRR